MIINWNNGLGQLSSSFDHAYEGRCDLSRDGSPDLLFC